MSNKFKSVLLLALSDVFFIAFWLFMLVNPWADANYPMQKQWNVFFVLSADTSGHDSGTGLSIFLGFVLPSILIYLVYFFVRLGFYLKKKVMPDSKKSLLITFFCFVFSLAFTFVFNKGWKYIYINSLVNKAPEQSDFYDGNFIPYESVSLSAPYGKTNNLIYIFLESMEGSFSDVEHGGILKYNLIPELTQIASENTVFGSLSGNGGLENLEATAWTSAGILSKTLAVPYFLPFSQDSDGNMKCLAKTKSLYDYLSEQGYRNVFAMGSEKQFENRDLILENHSVEVHDINYYKKHKLIPEDYQVFWGFEDQKLYEMAKIELEELAASGEKFSFSMLTVDTHFPNGYKCEKCRNIYPSQIENVFDCSDRQVGEFFAWIKKQEWAKDTTIVITGDHAYLDAPLNNFIRKISAVPSSKIDSMRRVYNVYINPIAETSGLNRARDYSSFDLMPTILNAVGFDFNTEGIALGRSLFKEYPTVVEKYGKKETERQFLRKTITYESLK